VAILSPMAKRFEEDKPPVPPIPQLPSPRMERFEED